MLTFWETKHPTFAGGVSNPAYLQCPSNYRFYYKQYATPWFDYLFVSKTEIEDILDGTAWWVERYIDAADTPTYVAILSKCMHS